MRERSVPNRRVLVVGGTGLIGGAAALHLASLGFDVSICARHAPEPGELGRLPFVKGDYLGEELSADILSRYDILVFAAGNDLRQLPPDGAYLPDHAVQERHFHAANTIGVPNFFKRAKKAGIGRAVYVGSYYPQVVESERVAASPYLRSRKAADEGVRALAAPEFRVCSLNAPFVLGKIEGVAAASIEGIMRYLLEARDRAWCIPGGANFISSESFAQAVAGAITSGKNGAAYLIGDQNWTFLHYFNLLLAGLGRPPIKDVRDASHPALIDEALYAGRGTIVSFDPDPAMVEQLGYARGNVERVTLEMAEYYAKRVTS